MSEFIAVGGVKKLKTGPQPNVRGLADTGTDAKLGGMEVNLAENIVQLTPGFSDETHVHACVAVPEQIHCGSSGGVSVSADLRQVQEAVCWLFCRWVVSSHPDLPHGAGLLV